VRNRLLRSDFNKLNILFNQNNVHLKIKRSYISLRWSPRFLVTFSILAGRLVVRNVSSLNGEWLHFSGSRLDNSVGIEGLYRRIKR
jgi:hypothetical protein